MKIKIPPFQWRDFSIQKQHLSCYESKHCTYWVVFNMTKIQVRKQFTTTKTQMIWQKCCFQYDEDTSSKAIHNQKHSSETLPEVVFNMTKIQVRKQFTTFLHGEVRTEELFSIWRRYKFESNSQLGRKKNERFNVVFNMTKIQVRKQFTTSSWWYLSGVSLFSIWRRYKFESNSQLGVKHIRRHKGCFQYDEDTSSKAIHNKNRYSPTSTPLFSIWRRYKFESNSQLVRVAVGMVKCCFQYDEDTSSKAIHNHSYFGLR